MSDVRDAAAFSYARSLDGTLDKVWRLLTRGVADRHAPERHLTMANIAMDGSPQLRTVVLRSADRGAGTLTVHTDAKSAKVVQLENDPRCALHVWNPKQKLQMRISAEAKIRSGPSVADIWARVPTRSRSAYGGTPYPGSQIDHPDGYADSVDASRFCVLCLDLIAIETLCLAPDRHYRANFSKHDSWAGQWFAP